MNSSFYPVKILSKVFFECRASPYKGVPDKVDRGLQFLALAVVLFAPANAFGDTPHSDPVRLSDGGVRMPVLTSHYCQVQ
jgi:hypothetical protein